MLCFLGQRGRRGGVLSLLRFEFRRFTCAPSCSSFCLSIQTVTCQPTHPSSVRMVIRPFVRQSVFHLSIHPHIHLSSSYHSIYPCIHPPVSVHPSSHVLIEYLLCSVSYCRALLTTKSYPHVPESYQGWRWGKTDQCNRVPPHPILPRASTGDKTRAMLGERKAHSPGVRPGFESCLQLLLVTVLLCACITSTVKIGNDVSSISLRVCARAHAWRRVIHCSGGYDIAHVGLTHSTFIH